MKPRILSGLEEKQIRAYLKRDDGKKTMNIRVLTFRAEESLPTIKADLALLEKLLKTYAKR